MARWALFYPAVFLSAWFGGFGSGITATIGSGLLVWWGFMPPERSWTDKDPKNVLAAVIFAFMSIGVSALQQRLRNLADQRRLFAALIDNSGDFIGIADPSGKPVYLNPAGRAMVGLDPDAPIAHFTPLEFYAPSAREFVTREIAPTTATKGVWQGETWFRHWRAETEIPVWQNRFLVRDPKSGRLLGSGTISRDVSELKRGRDELNAANRRLAEQARALTESQRLLQAIMDFSPAFVVVKDLAGRYVMLNRPVASVLGLSVDAARGKTDLDIFPPEIAERHRAIDASVIAKAEPSSYEEEFERNGTRRVFLVTKFPLHDADNRIFGVCAMWLDITERKRAEEALRQREADLREAERIAHVGSWTWDSRTDTPRLSDELYRIFGRDPSEPLPPLFSDDIRFFAPESLTRLREAVEADSQGWPAAPIGADSSPPGRFNENSERAWRHVARFVGHRHRDPRHRARRHRAARGPASPRRVDFRHRARPASADRRHPHGGERTPDAAQGRLARQGIALSRPHLHGGERTRAHGRRFTRPLAARGATPRAAAQMAECANARERRRRAAGARHQRSPRSRDREQRRR